MSEGEPGDKDKKDKYAKFDSQFRCITLNTLVELIDTYHESILKKQEEDLKLIERKKSKAIATDAQAEIERLKAQSKEEAEAAEAAADTEEAEDAAEAAADTEEAQAKETSIKGEKPGTIIRGKSEKEKKDDEKNKEVIDIAIALATNLVIDNSNTQQKIQGKTEEKKENNNTSDNVIDIVTGIALDDSTTETKILLQKAWIRFTNTLNLTNSVTSAWKSIEDLGSKDKMIENGFYKVPLVPLFFAALPFIAIYGIGYGGFKGVQAIQKALSRAKNEDVDFFDLDKINDSMSDTENDIVIGIVLDSNKDLSTSNDSITNDSPPESNNLTPESNSSKDESLLPFVIESLLSNEELNETPQEKLNVKEVGSETSRSFSPDKFSPDKLISLAAAAIFFNLKKSNSNSAEL